MKKRLLVAALGVVAGAALVATSMAVAAVTTLHLNARDNHKSFTVPTHAAIVITLQSCADCGYSWKRGPTSAVKLVSHRYVQNSKHGEVGGTGKEIWRFKVDRPSGETGGIQLRYVSPARHVAKRFVVGLRIE